VFKWKENLNATIYSVFSIAIAASICRAIFSPATENWHWIGCCMPEIKTFCLRFVYSFGKFFLLASLNDFTRWFSKNLHQIFWKPMFPSFFNLLWEFSKICKPSFPSLHNNYLKIPILYSSKILRSERKCPPMLYI